MRVSVAASYGDSGAKWGWRLFASTDPAAVADPAPFAQLDYSQMRSAVQAVRSDCAARGMLYSSFCDQAVRDAKEKFFSDGMSRDLSIWGSILQSPAMAAASVGFATDTATDLYLGGPGVWYVAAATATESRIEWSDVQEIVVPSRSDPPPVPTPTPMRVATPAVQPISTPVLVVTPSASAKTTAACLTTRRAIAANGRKLVRARRAARAGKTRVTRLKAKRSAHRLTVTRKRLIVRRARVCA